MKGEPVINSNKKRIAEDMNTEATTDDTKKSKKTRCSFWPLCLRGDDCFFWHPKELCLNFPSCVYGDKCLYIHPSIPNSFGSSFNSFASEVSSSVPCKRGFACSRSLAGNKQCSFQHPLEACKFGAHCTKSSFGSCNYSHSPVCRFGVTCNNPICTFAHVRTASSPCKFGSLCKNKYCAYDHPEESRSLSISLPLTPPRESMESTTEN